MRTDTRLVYYIVADFVAALVLAWVLNRISSAFGDGAKGGAAAGFYLGVLVNFPAYHFLHLMAKNYPIRLCGSTRFTVSSGT